MDLHLYKKGSKGPKAADELLAKDGFKWFTHFQMPEPIIFQTTSETEFYSTILEDLLLSIKESISQRNKCIIGLSGWNNS